jgi:hypothetical protein
MKNLIDIIPGFSTAGFAANGSGSGKPALPTATPFTVIGQPVIEHVQGENEPDFVEVFTLGQEGKVVSIYQCETSINGVFASQWYKIIADNTTDLTDANTLSITPPALTALAPTNYFRKVSTGSQGFHAGATPGTTSFKPQTFDLTGHGNNISYTQEP